MRGFTLDDSLVCGKSIPKLITVMQITTEQIIEILEYSENAIPTLGELRKYSRDKNLNWSDRDMVKVREIIIERIDEIR